VNTILKGVRSEIRPPHETMHILKYTFVKVLALRKAFKVLSTAVLARKERCWTLNCKARTLYAGCRKPHTFYANGFEKLGFKLKKHWCSKAALHFSFTRRNPHKQLQYQSLVSDKGRDPSSTSRHHCCAWQCN